MAIYCSQCGTPNDDQSVHCYKCGTPLIKPQPSDPSSQEFQSAAFPGQYNHPENTGHGEHVPTGPVDTKLTQSILVTLCCCMVFGIVAIVYSTMAQARNSEGKYPEAAALAKKANAWGIASLVGGLIAGALYALVIFLGEAGTY